MVVTCAARQPLRLRNHLLYQVSIEPNIADRSELAAVLSDLAISAGLHSNKRWSVTLPEAATRTLIFTLETPAGSRSELEEVMAGRWTAASEFP